MSELIPVDLERCQTEKPNGQNAFTLGGGHKMVRCENPAAYVATEKEPGPDGKIGSMSLCLYCLPELVKQFGNSVDIKVIENA